MALNWGPIGNSGSFVAFLVRTFFFLFSFFKSTWRWMIGAIQRRHLNFPFIQTDDRSIRDSKAYPLVLWKFPSSAASGNRNRRSAPGGICGTLQWCSDLFNQMRFNCNPAIIIHHNQFSHCQRAIAPIYYWSVNVQSNGLFNIIITALQV